MVFWAFSTVLTVLGLLLAVYVIYGDPGRTGFSRTQKALLAETEELGREVWDRLAPHRDAQHPEVVTLSPLGGLPLRGNSMRLLPRGEKAFEPIFAAIDSARAYVLVQFYIYRDDSLGQQMQDRLVSAARRGARVYLLIDKLESSLSPEYLQVLAQAGVEVVGYRPERSWTRLHWKGFRNHRKMVVVDGLIAILGGINVGDEYVDRVPKRAPWIDTQLELRGPAVLAAQLSYARDYYCACRHLPELSWTVPRAEGDCSVALLATNPDPDLARCTLMFAAAMAAAKERLWMATPYFIPDEKGITALELAVLRGVEVRVLLPGSSDIYPTEFLAWHYIERLAPLGVRFFHQRGGSMHQKVLLVDSDTALIGSANYDHRSLRLNLELTAWIRGSTEAAAVEQMLRDDFSNCDEVTPEQVRARTAKDRFLTAVTKVFAPVM